MPLGASKLGVGTLGGRRVSSLAPAPEEAPIIEPIPVPPPPEPEPTPEPTPEPPAPEESVVATGSTALGLQLYAAVAPLAYADGDNNFDLLNYCDALVQAGQPAETYGRDTGDIPGWGILMSADTAPPETLDWLSQFTGAFVSDMRRATVIGVPQNQLLNPNFNRSALTKAPARWVSVGNEKFEVTEGWEAGKKALFIKTNTLGAAAESVAVAEGAANIGGGPLSVTPVVVEENALHALRANIKVTALAGAFNIFIRVKWYDINSNLLSTTITAATAAAISTMTLTGSDISPAGAAAALFEVVAESTAAGGKLSWFVDEAGLLRSDNAEQAYGDGDAKGWAWEGEPGNSASGTLMLQTEAEFIEAKRAKVREESAQERGTLQAIASATQRFLIGNKTFFIQERDGSAYKLSIITYESQTPDPAQVKAAIEEQVPGGIILNYAAVKGATYFALRLNYGKYTDVEAAFATYNGVRNNVLGT